MVRPTLRQVMRTVGANVRRERESRGWSQEHLAERAGLSWRTVLRAEHGEGVQLASVVALARALHVSVAELFQE